MTLHMVTLTFSQLGAENGWNWPCFGFFVSCIRHIDMASTMKFCDVCGKTCETAKIFLECKKKHSKDTY